MIKTWFGYMTAQEAKMIGDIARDEKRQNKKDSRQPASSLRLNLFAISKNNGNNDSHRKSKNG